MILTIYSLFLGLMSLITLITYAVDKKKAINNAWRIPEKTLLLLSFFGGSIGGLIAIYFIRHKSKHLSFKIVNFLGFIIQYSILGLLIYNTITNQL